MEKMFYLLTEEREGIARCGVALLAGTIASYLPYVLPVRSVGEAAEELWQEANVIAVGDTASHPLLAQCAALGLFSVPQKAEGYAIYVGKSPFAEGKELIAIAGYDAHGILYGCVDFCNKYLGKFAFPSLYPLPDGFDRSLFQGELAPWCYAAAPAISHRAVWTWGHVIYDYRALLDNMVRLRLNEIVIWNDRAPINAASIIDYAHARGIRVILGYAWGWGVRCEEIIADLLRGQRDASLRTLKESVIRTYEEEYASLNADGIYFQSFTELSAEEHEGVCIASLVTETVNEIAEELFSRYPSLHLQFGLHATSVRSRLFAIKEVDPRITIVWEDCGAFPYAYDPRKTEGFDETLAFTQALLSLRGREEKFGCVFKGMLNLDWTRFSHFSAPYLLGERTKDFIRRRTDAKNPAWRLITAAWLKNAEYARRTVEAIARGGRAPVIEMLVEDAMLEEKIFFPAALCAEMLWTPYEKTEDLMETVAAYPTVGFPE